MARHTLPRGMRETPYPTGLTIWSLPGTSDGCGIMWAGPGARLVIGYPTMPGGAVTTIDHPTADGAYDTRAAARAAVIAFMAAAE